VAKACTGRVVRWMTLRLRTAMRHPAITGLAACRSRAGVVARLQWSEPPGCRAASRDLSALVVLPPARNAAACCARLRTVKLSVFRRSFVRLAPAPAQAPTVLVHRLAAPEASAPCAWIPARIAGRSDPAWSW